MNEYNEKDTAGATGEDQAGSQKPAEAGSGESRQYWSSQDARRASTPPGSSSYQPNSRPTGYQRPYEPYRQQGGYPPPPPPWQQHYSQGAGWQQNSGAPNERYEWNFNDYDQYSHAGERKKKKNRGLIVFAAVALCVVAVGIVAVAAFGIAGSVAYMDEDRSQDQVFRAPEEDDTSDIVGSDTRLELSERPAEDAIAEVLPEGRLTIPQVAQKLLPSIVSVENYQQAQYLEATGLGSGIVMSGDGYIITNAHVVEGADGIKVTLSDGVPYVGRIVGADSRTDIAVLKIEADGLEPADFGNSDDLLIGETVIAIGNPASLNFAGSVTQGIVSALNRQVYVGNYTMNYIQTDAAINPGSSGGALVNEYGQVIGISSAKIGITGFEGIGFAIPISDAKPVIDDLIAFGRVRGRVMLGISGSTVDEVDARNANVPRGVSIEMIDSSSDLMNRGVRVKDIITHVNGERVYTLEDLKSELERYSVGDTVRLTLYRQTSVLDGNEFEVSIVLIEDTN